MTNLPVQTRLDRRTMLGTALVTGVAALAPATTRAASKTLIFAYQDMASPYRVLMEQGAIEKATGYGITWRKFAAGGDVIRAMASGNVVLGEAGSSPIAAAASQGVNLALFWILDDIADAEQLIVRPESHIASLADLKGKTVAVPFVSTAHYQLMFALQKAGLEAGAVKIINLRPAEIAAAWERKDIDAAFVWGPVLLHLKQTGTVLLSAETVAKQGRPTFDGLAVDRDWASANTDFMVTLVKLLAAANAAYAADRQTWLANPAHIGAVAKWTGADPATVPAEMMAYRFPTLAEQASAKWLGGGAAQALKDTAAFLQAQGRIASTALDYRPFVTDAFVKAAMR